jgi:hypothetical protein
MIEKVSQKLIRQTERSPKSPRSSQAEIAQRQAEDEQFADRCRAVFRQVYPQLSQEYAGGFIYIEPESGDYFIALERSLARQKAKQKYPTARLMAMGINETGAVGRI